VARGLLDQGLLLGLVSLIFGLAVGLCHLARPEVPLPGVALAEILGAFWGAHALLAGARRRGDPLLLPLAALLCCLGWVMVWRLSPELGLKQATWILVGVAVFVAAARLPGDYRALEDYKYLFLLAGVLLQAAVMIFGVEINGARLWFRFGPVYFQPVEVLKVLLVVFLAAFLRQFRQWLRLGMLSREGRLPRRALLLLTLGWAAGEGVLVLQKDLGMALLLFGVFVAMFYISTGRTDLVAASGVLFLAGAWVCYGLFDHVRTRVLMWLDPFSDAQDRGFQMVQALCALAWGGLDGTGLGLGRPDLIPEAHTDFVFVALGEELGLLGAVALLVAVMVLVARAFRIALTAGDEFGTLLAAGLGTLLAWQTLVIVGGTLKLVPMTGITLPFMSYGGSSMLANFLVLGLLWRMAAAAEGRGADPAVAAPTAPGPDPARTGAPGAGEG
jgi:cell division protein FtsW